MVPITRFWGRCRCPWVVTGLAVLLAVACHDASRDNVVDASLTPGVQLLSAEVDSLQGSVTLTWSRYEGEQPFDSYLVIRRDVGRSEGVIRQVIPVVSQTTYRDSGLVVGASYTYSVQVESQGGLQVSSDPWPVSFSMVPPLLQSVTFESATGSATLVWRRAASGFEHYEVRRQDGGELGIRVVKRTSAIDDTVYRDEGLEGNTEYTYTIMTRSTGGSGLETTPISGGFHTLVAEWHSPVAPEDVPKAAAIGPDGSLYVCLGNPPYGSHLPLAGSDRLRRFTGAGQELGELHLEPESSPEFHTTRDAAADNRGVYVLLEDAVSSRIATPDVASYVRGYGPEGSARFRWPETGYLDNLAALDAGPDGMLWVARAASGSQVVLHVLDPDDGELVKEVVLEGVNLFLPAHVALAIGPSLGVIQVNADQPLAAFDLASGELLPVSLSGVGSHTSMSDLSLGPDERVYLLNFSPYEIVVLRDWEYLTGWSLLDPAMTPFYPGSITLDSAGYVYSVDMEMTADRAIRVRTYSP